MPGFDRVADVYDATRSLRPDVMEKVVDALISHLAGYRVIDIGVGTGRFAAPMASSGVDVVGVDISERMMRQALSKGARNLLLSDARRVPFRDQSFDYALAVHFLHLVHDWREVIAEIARVARRGLLTIIEDLGEVRPTEVYIQIRREMDPTSESMRFGERNLASSLKPSLMEEVASYEEEFSPQELVGEYAEKLRSVTWGVPDELNRRIVAEMARRVGERRVVRSSVTLAVWTREQLLEFHHST